MSRILNRWRDRKDSREDRGQRDAKSVPRAHKPRTKPYVKRDIDSDTGLYVVPVEELDKVPG